MVTLAIKSGRVKGFKGNIFVRNYGETGAVGVVPQGESVVVNYSNGTAKEYRMRDGIHLRTL